MKVLITGASGILGTELMSQLVDTQYTIYALTSNKRGVLSKFGTRIKAYSLDELYSGKLVLLDIDVVIHCAFTRTSDGAELIKSLELSKEIFKAALVWECDVINLSSRSVYGQNVDVPWKENFKVSPNNLYGLAKYSSELLLESYFAVTVKNRYTNIRLAGLISPDFDDRIINKFIDNAIKGLPIKIVGGSQQFGFLDLRDAARGLITLLKRKGDSWKTVYNLGSESTYTILEIAESIKRIARTLDMPTVVIDISITDVQLIADMDSTIFYKEMNWKPSFDLDEIVRNIFQHKLDLQNG